MSAAIKNNGCGVHGGLRLLRDVVAPGSTTAKGEGEAASGLPTTTLALRVVSVAANQILEVDV